MTQFLYCFPGVKNSGGLKLKTLFRESGIEYAYKEGAKYQITPVTNTPAEQSGIIVQADGDFSTCRYNPDEQVWGRIEGTECYVGKWKTDVFKPEDLARKEQIDGYYLKLRDGNDWIIPVARFNMSEDNSGCLRHQLALDKNGKMIKGALPPRQEKLSEIARDLLDKILNYEGKIDEQYGENYPFDILAGNYRIWKAEVALLQLWYFEDDYEKNIILFFIDAPGFAELKKKELESSNSNAGKKD